MCVHTYGYIIYQVARSLKEAGIDRAIIDHDIGAVYYNGSTTLKQVMKMGDSVLLLSANPKYEPIHIAEGDFSIMEKLVGVIRAL